MATVFIPSLMQKLSDGNNSVQVEGATVRQIVNNLDDIYPDSRTVSLMTAESRATYPSPWTVR